jgi:hypothetical protein
MQRLCMITWRWSKSKAIRGDMQSVSAWINMAVLEDSGGEAGAARRAPTGILFELRSSRNKQRLYRYPCNLGEEPWDGLS